MIPGAALFSIALVCSSAPDATPKAARLAESFAPEIAGKLVAQPVAPGDYAMSLAMSFVTFPSMEMRIEEKRSGAMTLSLAKDGSAHVCLGSRGQHGAVGQYHYEPPGKRQGYRSNEDVRLAVMTGHWSIADGVAQITFDALGWQACDPAKVEKMPSSVLELRCVGTAPNARVPVAGLACEANPNGQLLELGMPMKPATAPTHSPIHSTPAGQQVILGSPGLVVTVDQDSHAEAPTFTFKAGAVVLDESSFRTAPVPKPR